MFSPNEVIVLVLISIAFGLFMGFLLGRLRG